MASKVFLDANVLLDFLLKRAEYDAAKQLFKLVEEKKIRAFVTPAIIHIVAYWMTKAYGNAKAKDLLLLLLTDIQVIDCNHEVAINALHSKIDDVEDALQYYTALHHKLDFFISEDKKLQKSGVAPLPIYSAKDFIGLI